MGETLDDALGECFDKVAKILGLEYPGGPKIEVLAKEGDADKFTFPITLKNDGSCNFSFSGLKTAVLQQCQKLGDELEAEKANIAASFQKTCGLILAERLQNAFGVYGAQGRRLVVAGGVAANQYLRGTLNELCKANDFECHYAPMNLCTDNAAMIAWAGIEKFKKSGGDALDFEPRARWPLAG